MGNALSNFAFGMFGVLAYAFPVPVFLIPAFMISNRQDSRRGSAYSGRVIMKVTAGILLFLFLCVFAHIVCSVSYTHLDVYKRQQADHGIGRYLFPAGSAGGDPGYGLFPLPGLSG